MSRKVMGLEGDDDIRVLLAKHIESQGWKVALVGRHGIKQSDPTHALKYEYFMEFIGVQTPNDDSEETIINEE